MTIKLSPIGNDAPFYKAGVQASGCKLFVYAAGSTTKATTYTDNTGNTQNANPIILNSEGYPASGGSVVEIWLTTGSSYKFVLAPSTDTDPPSSPIWTRDNVAGVNDASLTLDEWIAGPTPTFVSSTQFTLVGDQTNNFHVGRRVKYTVTAGTGYATITASAFAVVTTVTVDSQGSNALDSGLSTVSYGLLRADNFTQSTGLDSITRYATAIAAAATLNLNAVGGDYIHLSTSTATSTITSVTLAQGHQRIVVFDSPQVLSNGTGLLLRGGINRVAQLGEAILLRGETGSVVREIVPGTIKIPTRTVLTTSTGTYSTPVGATRINVRLVGGGGSGATSGANGANTVFGTLTGSGGVGAGVQGGAGGAGGAASGGDINIAGGNGQGAMQNSVAGVLASGCSGGSSYFGGAGGGGQSGNAGTAAATNSGSGGGSDGVGSAANGRPSGGAGGYVEKRFVPPSATYTYNVGAGGAGGTGGQAGGDGIIIIDEFYD